MWLVLVTLQRNGFATSTTTQSYANATVAYGRSMGIPVINMYALGGVSELTTGTLTRDSVHPSDYGFSNFYGPVIAQGLQQIF